MATVPVVNPTKVTFQASPDHATLRLDGSAVVASYRFDAAGGAVAVTADLGKQTPDATGAITLVVPALSTLTPNALYTATVTAVGPDGTTASPASDPFGKAAPLVPRAAGKPVLS